MDESAYLKELATKPLPQRIAGYLRLSGPGYMQSAMTLGGGSIASCVLMASLLGYELLWVQPLAIVLGFFVLAALAKQTCSTGEKPYAAFWNRLHPALAIMWGASAMIATVLWHIPQYSLTANGVIVLAGADGTWLAGDSGRLAIGLGVLLLACGVVFLYDQGMRGIRIYELAVKCLVWAIVVAFGIVAFATGIDLERFAMGITGVTFFRDRVFGTGVPPQTIVPIVGGIAAAVGINMVFLYPYSLLRKKWGREHEELAYFDLFSGMVVPFLIATTFMMVAVANTIGPESGAIGAEVKDIRAILPVLNESLGATLSLLLIGLGMSAIGFSTIITHMLASGFIGCELFGTRYEGPSRWWFSLIPAVGVVGVLIQAPWFAAVTASSLAACLMPVAVIGFIILMNMKSYMGDARPSGLRRFLWNTALITAVAVVTVASIQGLRGNWHTLQNHLRPAAESAEET
ncbi:MAG: divalent metal cation transporter [Planctomycetaceae bacterium]